MHRFSPIFATFSTFIHKSFSHPLPSTSQKKQHCRSPPHLHGIILTAPIHMNKKSSEAVSEQPNLGQTLLSLPITFARQATTPEIILLDKNCTGVLLELPPHSLECFH